jgi:aerobic-type carbon monoxide dehydrogenase small subunit (CoxS/CutS family)
VSPSDSVRVNGEQHAIQGWRGRRLLDFLRFGLGLTGTKEGCGEGECGACTVLFDGEPVCSCLLLTDVACGRDVRTVEGLDPSLRDRVIAEVGAEGGVQCGFCTPGFAVMAQWLVTTRPQADTIGAAAEPCRCTGYVHRARAP